MMNKATGRIAVAWVAALAIAGCSNVSVVGGVFDGGVSTDLGAGDSATDVAMDVAMDVPADVPADTGPMRCTTNTDCMGNAAGGVCDTMTGRCVGCVATNDTCPANQHCDPASNACVGGCRADEGCAMGAGDAGVGDGGAPAGRCNTTTHMCQECVVDTHCPPGNVCSAGSCVRGCMADDRCATGERCCGGACVDPQSNAANCGACGTACSVPNAAPGCAMGACVIATCMAPFGNCDDMQANGCEVNLNTTVAHCGMCGNACPTRANASSTCDAGTCGFTCNTGFADCDMDPMNGCEVELAVTAANCGMCGRACVAANGVPSCVAGACAVGSCTEGYANCDDDPANGCEVDTRTTVGNCGMCGRTCPAPANGTAACVAGACGVGSCTPGYADCDGNPANGCEVDTRSTVGNCGMCGRSCGALANGTASCVAGVCGVGSCNTGFADCDGNPANGCEVNLNTSSANCGMCNRACPAPTNGSATCVAGVCGVGGCNAGFGNCDGNASNGCETATSTSVSHCGACGNVCAAPANASAACSGGACGLGSCNAGFANCDNTPSNGCEVNTTNNPANCGSCGRVCPAPTGGSGTCTAGVCGTACPTGRTLCSGACLDLQSDNNNCGACGRVCSTGSACAAGTCVGQGTLRFTLTWNVNGDMDLHVRPPCGTEIYYGARTACGGTLDVDNTSTVGPENIYWTSSYTPGTYLVCPESYTSAVANATWTLVVVRNGVEVHRSTGTRGGRTDGNTACTSSFPGVITLNL